MSNLNQEYRENEYENRETEYYYYVRAYRGKFIDDFRNDVYNDYLNNLDEVLEMIKDHHRDNLKVLVTRHKET
tara:strand:- start:994 stop:1212 length:219 start_codon:yes stop_codon:yes gene_type:complete